MKNIAKTHIANMGGGGVEWKIDAFIMITHHDDDMDEFTDARLYTEGQYGFYERTHTICSDNYCTTFRFDKDRIRDVLLHLADSPNDLEDYILTIKGCEMINQERY